MEAKVRIEVTQEMVNKFAEISGDMNPIHLDEEYAKNSKFGKKIAHGMLLGSFISQLIAKECPGPGSIYLSQSLQFVYPVFVGETVTIVVKENTRIKNKFFLYTDVFNESGEKVIIGSAEVVKM
jgi:3-hydroxybutyryl-CoA dehydratase